MLRRRLIISFPGLILYIFYLKILGNKIGIRTAKSVWGWTIFYNLLLMVGFLAITSLEAYPIAMIYAFTVGMAGIAYFDLVDEEKANLLEAQRIDKEIEHKKFQDRSENVEIFRGQIA